MWVPYYHGGIVLVDTTGKLPVLVFIEVLLVAKASCLRVQAGSCCRKSRLEPPEQPAGRMPTPGYESASPVFALSSREAAMLASRANRNP